MISWREIEREREREERERERDREEGVDGKKYRGKGREGFGAKEVERRLKRRLEMDVITAAKKEGENRL